MRINTITNTSFGTKKLVPLSEYKGTILKLTQKDKEQIAKLTKKKAEYELELMKVSRHLEKYTKSITKEWKYFSMVEYNLMGKISIIEDMIKEIKTNRLAAQNKAKKENFLV